MKKNPQYRYLFGPVTISNSYPKTAKDLLVYFYTLYFGTENKPATAFLPYQLSPESEKQLKGIFAGNDYRKDFKKLKRVLGMSDHTVPTLYKQYTEICDNDGIIFSDFNIDPDFSDCVDGFIIVDTAKIKPKMKQRYMGTD